MQYAQSPPTHEWPSEPASGRGRSHGTSSTAAFDRWFRYPAGFASDYVTMLLDSLGLQGGTVVDCFAGSGVTGTAARSRGLSFAGIEAHPMVAELATLKLQPTAGAGLVRGLCNEVIEAIETPPAEADVDRSETDLVQRSFTPSALSQLVALREAIQAREEVPAASYLKWALLATLRDVATVKVGWPYQRPGIARKARYTDPVQRFLARVEMMAADLESITSGSRACEPGEVAPTATVVVGDSRDAAAWSSLPPDAAACVASPPYLNNFDYADATRLELYFWGEVRTWADMCLHVRSGMVTATTQQSTVGEKERALTLLEGLQDGTSRRIIKLVAEIDAARKERNRRAKEYDRVAPAYFVAMRQILINLHAHLDPGASVLWLIGDSAPYGVYVDTPRLIGDLARGVGFAFAEDVNLRIRGNRWGGNSDRHKVRLSERLIVLSRT